MQVAYLRSDNKLGMWCRVLLYLLLPGFIRGLKMPRGWGHTADRIDCHPFICARKYITSLFGARSDCQVSLKTHPKTNSTTVYPRALVV